MKKKFCKTVAMVLSVLILSSAFSFGSLALCIYLGDADNNGTVDAGDALIVLQYSVGKTKTIDRKTADVNRDGDINSSDALLILQTAVGMVDPVPVTDDPPAHTHSYVKSVTAPTCTEKGYTLFTCSCGDTYKNYWTDPTGHSYKNYVCTKCGEVDKARAYEYFVRYIKENGDVDGDETSLIFYVDDVFLSIFYDAVYDAAYVSVYLDDGTEDMDNDLYTVIDLSGKGEYTFASYMGDGTCFGTGEIIGASYSKDSPFSMSLYEGPSELKSEFTEVTRHMVNLALSFLSEFIKQYVPGITVKDLGFDRF